MLKRKGKLEEYAVEIVRCEQVLQDEGSSKEDKRAALWKMESIVDLYQSDPEVFFKLMFLVEEKFSEAFDKNK